MKALEGRLRKHGFDPAGFRPLCGHDGTAVFAMDVQAEDARPTWERLRALTPQAGYWPVILIDRGGGFPLCPSAATEPGQPGDRSFEETLSAANAIDFERWVRDEHEQRIAR